jgi:hypothetical protein
VGAASGAAFVVLILVGNGIAEDGGNPALGVPLELLGFAALSCFVAYVATRLRAVSGWAPALALVAGVTTLAVKLGSAAPYLAAEYGEVGPDVAAGLVAASDAAFVVNWLPHGLFVVALAIVAMQGRHLSQAIGWAGVVVGLATIAAVPVSTGEPFVIPFLLSLLWLLVASVTLVRHELRGDGVWSVEV